jgi:hypothetical protein
MFAMRVGGRVRGRVRERRRGVGPDTWCDGTRESG